MVLPQGPWHCCQDWESASAIARAFSIGSKESASVANLQTKVSRAMLSKLKSAVHCRGMRNFITHEAIAKGVFNEGFSSGQGVAESWSGVFVNGDDDRVEACLLNVFSFSCSKISLFLPL